MRTNIDIDDKLLQQVMRDGLFPTKKAAVEAGLRALAQRRAARQLLALGGRVAWEGDLKAWRTSKRHAG
jgi:Arc/MetJ family transcription regulator